MTSRKRILIGTVIIAWAGPWTTIQIFSAEPPPPSLRATGLWRSGDGSKQVLVPGLPTGKFIAKRSELAQQGLAISTIAVYHAHDDEHYVAVFEPRPNNTEITSLLSGTWQQFAAKDAEMFKKGFRIADLTLSIDRKDARKVRYTAIWNGGLGTGAQWTDPAKSWNDFMAKAKERFEKGLRLVAMDAIAVLDKVQEGTHKALFVGTWRDGQGTGALYFIPPSKGPDYTKWLEKHFASGLRSVAFGAYTVDGHTPMYVGAVRGGLGEPGEWNSPVMKWNEFVAEHQSRVAKGYRLLDISVYTEFTKID